MFKEDHVRFFINHTIFSKSLLAGVSLFLLLIVNISSVQSQNISTRALKQPMVSHVLSNAWVTRSDENRNIEEGDFLNLGDMVRTGDDSVLRIFFQDGTTETLCENTTYRVQESGSEIYEDNDANSRENVIAALTRCDIRPRFIERCRSENGFISRYTKAGERGKVGGQTQIIEKSIKIQPNVDEERLDNNINNRTNLQERNDLNNSSRCTTGEQLFTNYVFIPQTIIEPSPVVQPTVPAPSETPVTVPEVGGSPVN